MNTPTVPTSRLRTFTWLLRREFWEHKGGFFWAPIWAGGISLLLTLMGLILAEVAAGRATGLGDSIGKRDVIINGLDLSTITAQMNADDLQKLTDGLAMSTASAMFWPLLVLGFVVFFYCLGSLYDERKDRSILFWKSLPISDRDTVLSKVTSAMVVAPAIAFAVGVVCVFAFLLLLSGFVLLHHGNPITLLWSPGKVLGIIGLALAALPIYALWALPSVGWLLLCSVAARSKPFLWAITLPVFAGVLLTWLDWMTSLALGSAWFWKHVVEHLLGGVFPGTFLGAMDKATLPSLLSTDYWVVTKTMYSVLAVPQLWIGALAGVLMIVAAIWLRRHRDDA